MLRIKLVKSTIGNNPRNRATIQALGLRKVSQVVEHADTPSIRGMIHHAKHMLSVETVEDTKPVAKRVARPAAKVAAKPTAKAAAKPEAAPKAAPAPKAAKKPKAKKEDDGE